jgi:hypothetical protein
MAGRRERKGVADDLLAIAAKLPWRMSLVVAAVSYALRLNAFEQAFT